MAARVRISAAAAAAALMPLVLLCGCGAVETTTTPSAPAAAAAGAANTAAAVSQRTVQGGRFIELVGPSQQFAAPFLGVPGTNYYVLRSWIDAQNRQATTQLYVEDSYVGAERTYDAARDAGGGGSAGQTLDFVPISRNEISCDNGCSYAEEFAAELPAPLLQQHTGDSGLSVTFSAKAGQDLTIVVPAELIAKQLEALAAAVGARPAAMGRVEPGASIF
jgi:hypothetical protein